MQVVNYFNILIFNILRGGFLFSCFPVVSDFSTNFSIFSYIQRLP